MKVRAARLVFSQEVLFADSLSARDFARVLEQLPADAKIRNFGMDYNTNTISIPVVSQSFKEVDESQWLPTIPVEFERTTNGTKVSVNLTEVLEPNKIILKTSEEISKSELTFRREYQNFWSGWDFNKEALKEYQVQINNLYSKIVENQVLMGTTNLKIQHDDSLPADGYYQYKITSVNPYEVYYSKPMAPAESYPEPSNADYTREYLTEAKKQCIHSNKQHYIGFTQEYDYCGDCNEKL